MKNRLWRIGVWVIFLFFISACAASVKVSPKPSDTVISTKTVDSESKKKDKIISEDATEDYLIMDKNKKDMDIADDRITPDVESTISDIKKDTGKITDSKNTVEHKLNIPQAGEHDDNEEFQYYMDFLTTKYPSEAEQVDLIKQFSRRVIVAVVDQNDLPLWNAELKYETQKILTYQDGEGILYIDSVDPQSQQQEDSQITIKYQGISTNISINAGLYDRIEVKLPTQRTGWDQIDLDIVFVMDTTGSMGDEISMLQDTLVSIYSRIMKLPVSNINLRFGMVLYKDQGDKYLTQVFKLTEDLEKFQNFLFTVTAGGGGDFPEDLWSGMEQTTKLNWKKNSIRLAFVVTDAPARYGETKRMVKVIQDCARERIKVFTIGASGLDVTGEGHLRMLSQATKGRFIFLTYGETGESEGEATKEDKGKVSHHTGSNYESRSLDDIVVDNVKREIYTQADNKVIAVIQKDYTFTDSKDLVYRRVDNALQQIKKQIAADKQGVSTVMILPPTPETESLKGLSEHIATLSEEIILQGKFLKVVDRKNLEAIMKELQLNMAGVTITSEIKQLTQADTLLAGKLYFVGGTSVLMIRLIDIQSSEVLAAAMVKI